MLLKCLDSNTEIAKGSVSSEGYKHDIRTVHVFIPFLRVCFQPFEVNSLKFFVTKLFTGASLVGVSRAMKPTVASQPKRR